jgi:cytoskeletal protein RodZ
MSSFGETLRRERELRQITLREISEATKVNLRYLEALERNDFRHLPGGVFNKGFIRAYAQYIGVDAEAMVNAYLEEESRQRLKEEERRRESFARAEAVPKGARRERGGEEGSSRTRRRRLAIVIAISVLLALLSGGIVAAIALFGWRKPARPAFEDAGTMTPPKIERPAEGPAVAEARSGPLPSARGSAR